VELGRGERGRGEASGVLERDALAVREAGERVEIPVAVEVAEGRSAMSPPS
jgi:hypothetical protein